jgi:microcystin-dependent protein
LILYSAYDADLSTLSVPASTTVTAFGKTLVGAADAAAAQVVLGSMLPAGIGPLPWPTDTPPTGWLLCYGQQVSRVTYAALWGVIGSTYGNGDGANTFNMPDMRGRIPLGKDNMGGVSADRVTYATADTLGGSGGAESHTHTTGDHTLTQYESGLSSHAHSTPAYSLGGGTPLYVALTGTMADGQNPVGNACAGASAVSAHNHGVTGVVSGIAMPYLTGNYIMKY